ncbi:MAG: hypothetical protein HWQ44_09690 [Nostoc sp. JL34]|uniref:hypothetical protein n=1 Tax=Nostoc sp. JL34 TaxID=2815397 RepID=UPI001D9B9CC2|nr:hypothetical protein [Nostoc sp. JL34]MBN3883240.1 hypothetical protein [Nostoc sp. JL34]
MRYPTTPQKVGFRSSTQPTPECFFRQNLRSIEGLFNLRSPLALPQARQVLTV